LLRPDAPEEPLTVGRLGFYPTDCSRDGKLLFGETPQAQVFVLPLNGKAEPLPVLHSGSNYAQPQLSPDGRWLAYVSDESGHDEVYVKAFSMDDHETASQWAISKSGGTDPRWRRDGKEL